MARLRPASNRERMFYVYILQSESASSKFYTGFTEDLKVRLRQHNAGESTHTSKFSPWKLRFYCAFNDRSKAEAFEAYLKSASGRAFQKRHF